jgi:hypothetical protein
MITTQPTGKQTGQYSRIANPRRVITTDAVRDRVRAGTNPSVPVRNVLAGADAGDSIFARLRAWLRGE